MADEPRFLPMAARGAGPPPVFERIAIVGLGLIGGSLALACRRRWPSALVVGVDRNAVLEKAVSRHAIDVASESLMIVSAADLVVLAAPMLQNVEIVGRLGDHMSGDAVVTDVGGACRELVEAAQALPGRLRFVVGHPLADAATGGIEGARADLFEGRPWLLVPAVPGADDALARLLAFAQALGAKPRVLESVAAHDRLMAVLGHLPEATASALVDAVDEHLGREQG